MITRASESVRTNRFHQNSLPVKRVIKYMSNLKVSYVINCKIKQCVDLKAMIWIPNSGWARHLGLGSCQHTSHVSTGFFLLTTACSTDLRPRDSLKFGGPSPTFSSWVIFSWCIYATYESTKNAKMRFPHCKAEFHGFND